MSTRQTQSRITVAIVAGGIVGVAWCLPQAWADSLWTNVPTGGAWENVANWNSNGVPSGTAVSYLSVGSNGNAVLTNNTASYTVNYDVVGNSFNNLEVSNAAAYRTTLNINTGSFNMVGLSEGNNSLGALRARKSAIFNVNSGGVWNLGANFSTYDTAILNINQGGMMTWGSNNPAARWAWSLESVMTVKGSFRAVGSSSLFFLPEGGGNPILTIDGGDCLLYNVYVSQNGSSGTVNITNNGVLIVNKYLEVGAGQYSSVYDAKVNLSSGAVTNFGPLYIAISSTISSAYSGNGAVNVSGGSFLQKGIAVVGRGRNGALNISGSGLFSTTNNMYVGNTFLLCPPTGSARASGIINMTGGQLIVTNNAGTAALFVGNAITGTVTLAGGTTTVDNLVATNTGFSFFNFNSGTLAVRVSSLVSNGTAFVAGNGTSSAILSLLGGTHSFSNGLVINTNAVFALGGTNAIGSATINGNVTLQTNAVVDCDFNQTTNDFVQVNGTVTLPAQATLQVRALDSSVRTPIPVLQATQLNGSTANWTRSLVNGRKYRAVVAGNQLVLERIPQGTVFVIR